MLEPRLEASEVETKKWGVDTSMLLHLHSRVRRADDLCGAAESLSRLAGGATVLCLLLLGLFASVAALAAARAEKTVDLTIVRGSLPAGDRLLRVNKGDALRLRISSDTPGEVHLHGYRLQANLAAGMPSELAFTAYATGRYRLEWHPAGHTQSGSHHGPPLAVLEVRPP
jgi:hypothetical protein